MASDRTKAIILAGGQSSRMGEDKAEIKIEGERLIEIAIRKLWGQDCDIYISAAHDYGTGLPVISDIPDGPRGPVAGLYAGLKYFENSPDISGFLTVPVDCPGFPNNLAASLISTDSSQIACDPERIHPTFGWWRITDLQNVFQQFAADGKISMTALAEKCGAKMMEWSEQILFLNINDPNDLNAYLTLNSARHKKR